MATPSSSQPESKSSADSEIEAKLMRFAEQLGYVIGTVHGKAEGWLNRDALRTQLTTVRDSASDLLKHVTGSATTGRKTAKAPARTAKSAAPAGGADLAHAPGKRHRKPAPSAKGVKHSDERIAKLKTAESVRRRRKD